MAEEIFLQHWIFTRFALPFFLVWFVCYAVLEKVKLLGDGKHQVNAGVSFVIAAIFVGVLYPTLVVSNLILFLSVALVVVFVALLLWGFVSGESVALPDNKTLKIILFVFVLISVAIALLWALGVQGTSFNLLFKQNWSESFWTNSLFIVAIALVIAVVLRSSGASGGASK
ncbi:MAG: hypothetical protein AABX28_00820 [Nanoarchaeota archaeon]